MHELVQAKKELAEAEACDCYWEEENAGRDMKLQIKQEYPLLNYNTFVLQVENDRTPSLLGEAFLFFHIGQALLFCLSLMVIERLYYSIT